MHTSVGDQEYFIPRATIAIVPGEKAATKGSTRLPPTLTFPPLSLAAAVTAAAVVVSRSLLVSHEIAHPVRVQSADNFFELLYYENFVDSRDFVHANRELIPQNRYLHTLSSVNLKKNGCLGV